MNGKGGVVELDERSYCFLGSGLLKVRRFCLNTMGRDALH
jgi:hypothetical protein